MAKRDRVQIIEVLAADVPRSFGDGSRDAPPAGEPRPRRRWWIVPAAVAGIVAVIVGAGALTDEGAARSGRPDGAELTGVAKVGPVVLPLVPTTPAGYRITGIEQHVTAVAGQRPVRQLWATHVATSTQSSWLEITASRDGLPPAAAGDGRVAVPRGIAVLDTAPNGDVHISGPIAEGSAQIVSSGVSRATVVELLGSLQFDGAVLATNDSRLGGMFQPVAMDDGAAPATGNGASLTVAYESVASGPHGPDGFTVEVSAAGSTYDEAARRFFLTSSTKVAVNGQDALVGGDQRNFGTSSVTFERAGLRVTIDGTAPKDVLAVAVQSVHVATGAELAALLRAGPITTAATASDPGVEVASGELGGNLGRYTIDVRTDSDGTAAVTLTSADGTTAVGTVTVRGSYVAVVASPTMTAAVAFLPADTPDAHLTLAVGDPAFRELEATAVDVGGVRVVAAAFADAQPFTATLVAPDGGVLSTATG